MRYRELHIENFGIHRQRKLAFDAGLQVIYGPNETGKSTLLSLLREILFRIQPRTPYLQCSANGALAAKVKFDLKDGRRGSFRRQKGNPDRLTGQLDDGRALDSQDALDALLGADPLLYEHVFAFSAEELRAGAASLQVAGLGEALFGGGLGGLTQFQALQSRIEKRLGSLWKPSANARNARINEILPRLKRAEHRFRDSQHRPQELEELQSQREQHERLIREQDEELKSLQARRVELQQLSKALPVWRKLVDACESRRGVPSHSAVTPQIAASFHKLSGERSQLAEKLRSLDEQALRQPTLPPLSDAEAAVLSEENALTALRYRLPSMEQIQSELPKLRAGQLRLSARLSVDENAGPRLKSITGEQRDTLLRLIAQSHRLTERRRGARDRLGDIDGPLTEKRRAFERLGPSQSTEEWDARASAAVSWKTRTERHAGLAKELSSLQLKINSLSGRLAPAWPHVSAEPHPLPLRSTIQTYSDRWKKLSANRDITRQRLEDSRQELERAEQSLADSERAGPADDREGLVQLRNHRDAGWRLLVRSRLAPPSSALEADLQAEIETWTDGRPERLVELYEQSVIAADQQADAALDRAQLIADRDQRARQVDASRRRLTEQEQRLQNVDHDQAQLESEWRTLWASARIDPLSPVEMLDWLNQVEVLQRDLDDAAGLQKEADLVAEQIEEFEAELVQYLPQVSRSSPEAVVAMIQKRAERVRKTEDERRRLLDEIDDLERSSQRQSQDVAGTEEEWRNCQEDLRKLLGGMSLPVDWDIEALQEELARFDAHAEARSELAAVEGQLADLGPKWEEFVSEIESVAARIATGLTLTDPVAAARGLIERLEAAQKRRRLLDEQREATAGDAKVRELKSGDLQRCDEQLQTLAVQAGVDSLPDLEQAVDAFDRGAKLDGEIQALRRDLTHILGRDSSAMDSRLSESSETALQSELQENEDRQSAVQQARSRELACRGVVEEKIRVLQESTDALARGAELESIRAELTDAVHQWGPLALTQTIMRRARDRFEREHQPALLAQVAQLLERITNGEHRNIRRTLGDSAADHDLLIEDREQTLRTPTQLSDGARAQLYLAVRLAFVAEHCQGHEPLPLVMDDVLVEFDEDRARRALEVLAEFAEYSQVLLLTHHQRTVELWRELRPSAAVLQLDDEESVPELPPKRKKSARRTRRRETGSADSALLFPPGER